MEAGTIIGIIGFLGLVVGGAVILKSKVPKETIENYKSAIASFEVRTTTQEADISFLKTKLVKLEARLNVVETMPLQQLSQDYHTVTDTLNLVAQTLHKITESNGTILQNQLDMTDRLIASDKLKAIAVKQVKTDLKRDDATLERKVKAKVE